MSNQTSKLDGCVELNIQIALLAKCHVGFSHLSYSENRPATHLLPKHIRRGLCTSDLFLEKTDVNEAVCLSATFLASPGADEMH